MGIVRTTVQSFASLSRDDERTSPPIAGAGGSFASGTLRRSALAGGTPPSSDPVVLEFFYLFPETLTPSDYAEEAKTLFPEVFAVDPTVPFESIAAAYASLITLGESLTLPSEPVELTLDVGGPQTATLTNFVANDRLEEDGAAGEVATAATLTSSVYPSTGGLTLADGQEFLDALFTLTGGSYTSEQDAFRASTGATSLIVNAGPLVSWDSSVTVLGDFADVTSTGNVDEGGESVTNFTTPVFQLWARVAS